MISSAFRRLTAFVASLVLVLSLVPAVATAEGEDVTAPVLNSVTVLNSGTSVAKGEKLQLRVSFTETETGVSSITLGLTSDEYPSRSITQSFTYGENGSNGAQALFSKDGPITLEYEIPQNIPSGSWHVSELSLQDQAGRNACYQDEKYRQDTNNKNFNISDELTTVAIPFFTITGEDGDIDAPVISSLSVANSNATVDAPGTLELGMGLTEASGVSNMDITLVNQYGGRITQWYESADSARIEGDHTFFAGPYKTGTHVIEVPISANAKSGTWSVDTINLTDTAGNSVSYSSYGEANLTDSLSREEQIPTPTFTVRSENAETGIPTIASLTIENEEATVQKPGVVNLRLTLAESSSKVVSAEVHLRADNGDSSVAQSFVCGDQSGEDWKTRVEGPVVPGGSVVLPIKIGADAKSGGWHVTAVYLRDSANDANANTEVTDTTRWCFGEGDLVSPAFTVKDEFDYAFDYALTNPNLLQGLNELSAGKAARVLIDGNNVLPKAALDAIAGRDCTIVAYKNAEGYQWIIKGKDVSPNATKDLNLSLDIQSVQSNPLFSGSETITLTFADNGVLPGTVQVRLKNDYLYQSGVTGNLHMYYVQDGAYSEENTAFDFMFDGADNWCCMEFTHNSTFVVSPSEYVGAQQTTTVTGVTVSPKTLGLTVGGGTATLTANVEPAEAADRTVTWTSDNPSVATVSDAGVVTPVAAGTANITATTNGTDAEGNKKTDTCVVTVSAAQNNDSNNNDNDDGNNNGGNNNDDGDSSNDNTDDNAGDDTGNNTGGTSGSTSGSNTSRGTSASNNTSDGTSAGNNTNTGNEASNKSAATSGNGASTTPSTGSTSTTRSATGTTSGITTAATTTLAKTGDSTSYLLAAVVSGLSVAAITLGLRRRAS